MALQETAINPKERHGRPMDRVNERSEEDCKGNGEGLAVKSTDAALALVVYLVTTARSGGGTMKLNAKRTSGVIRLRPAVLLQVCRGGTRTATIACFQGALWATLHPNIAQTRNAKSWARQ